MLGTDAGGAVIVASTEVRPDVMETMTTTWKWSGSRWVPIRSDPSIGVGERLAYDPMIHKTVAITGGMTGPYRMWGWDGTSWGEIFPRTMPRTGVGAVALAYDPVSQQLVALVPESQTRSATWIYDGTTWTQSTSATEPPPRTQGAMAYDPGTKRLVLYGGNCTAGGPGSCDYTFTWDGRFRQWSPHGPDATPSGNGGLAFDPASSQLILVCQHPTDAQRSTFTMSTWTWTGSAWQPLHPGTIPPAGWTADMAYDAVHKEVVYFANTVDSSNNLGQTWTYSAGTWHRAN
jgi:hypothetical protein